MKRYCMLGLALVLFACNASPPGPTAGSENAPSAPEGDAPPGPQGAAPVEAVVILQGLIAYVETEDGGRPVVDSILVNARKGKDRLPEVYSQDAFDHHRPFMPRHEPFIAVENGEIEGSSCFVDTSAPRNFVLPWENLLSLEAHPLCAQAPCGDLVLNLGSTDFAAGSFDLDDLVDAGDFEPSCGADFLTLGDSPSLRPTARVRLNRGRTVEAQVLACSVTFGSATLEGDREGACAGGGERLAEQVAVSGPHPVTLSKGAKTCRFSPKEPAKPMRLWLFNVHADSYAQAHRRGAEPHHSAFYWYYDLAPADCNGVFPRPCDDHQNFCAGDPKCPQVKLRAK